MDVWHLGKIIVSQFHFELTEQALRLRPERSSKVKSMHASHVCLLTLYAICIKNVALNPELLLLVGTACFRDTS